jgi:hypothetical protein
MSRKELIEKFIAASQEVSDIAVQLATARSKKDEAFQAVIECDIEDGDYYMREWIGGKFVHLCVTITRGAPVVVQMQDL